MKIIESIYKEPYEWSQGDFTFDHSSGLSIWTDFGLFFYNTYPKGSVSFLWKLRFAWAYRWWTQNQPVDKGGEVG